MINLFNGLRLKLEQISQNLQTGRYQVNLHGKILNTQIVLYWAHDAVINVLVFVANLGANLTENGSYDM